MKTHSLSVIPINGHGAMLAVVDVWRMPAEAVLLAYTSSYLHVKVCLQSQQDSVEVLISFHHPLMRLISTGKLIFFWPAPSERQIPSPLNRTTHYAALIKEIHVLVTLSLRPLWRPQAMWAVLHHPFWGSKVGIRCTHLMKWSISRVLCLWTWHTCELLFRLTDETDIEGALHMPQRNIMSRL